MHTITFDQDCRNSARELIRQALAEDLGPGIDCTTAALFPTPVQGTAHFVCRDQGRICGLTILEMLVHDSASSLELQLFVPDGAPVESRKRVATVTGDAREILKLERTALNFLGRLSGIASLTERYVKEIQGTRAGIYDTRKTTPGWRYLEKYAVRCGGGCNHRLGLYDAILIKDNHLAMWDLDRSHHPRDLGDAIAQARGWLATQARENPAARPAFLQVEVDNWLQFERALPAKPDIILLDNWPLADMRRAVTTRDERGMAVELEASGGVNLETVAAIAKTGVDRISVGALTHSAKNFDIGLDWVSPQDVS